MTHLDEFINSNVLGELYYGNSGSSEESSVLFTNPLADITAAFENQISDAFQSIENALKKGFFVSGYFSYELGYFLDTTGCEFQPNGNPLLHFRVYTKKHDIPSKECHDAFQKYVSAQTNDYWIKDIRQSISKEA